MIRFEEKTHQYFLNGVELPSVTTIIRPLTDSIYKGIDPAILQEAADRGRSIHSACEIYALYGIEEAQPEWQGYLDGFVKFVNDFKPVEIQTEVRVWHELLQYAGSADMVCTIGKKRTVVDIKSTAAVNLMSGNVQVEAYARALQAMGQDIDQKIILHLTKSGGYKAHITEGDNRVAWDVFNACLLINRYIRREK